MKYFLGFLFFLGFFLALLFVDAFVLTKLWGWFITPLGLPCISYSHALGVSALVSYLTHQYIGKSDSDDDVSMAIWAFGRPIITLLCGWVFHSFI